MSPYFKKKRKALSGKSLFAVLILLLLMTSFINYQNKKIQHDNEKAQNATYKIAKLNLTNLNLINK